MNSKNEASRSGNQGIFSPILRREQNPSKAEIHSHPPASLRSQVSAKGDKLSIIIPAYNEENTILKVINNVLKQSCVFEIIIVNDGSKDKTRKILSKIYSEKIKIYHHKINQGKGKAITTALRHVSGNLILIQDADLEYSPSEYKKLLSYSNQNVVVYGSRLLRENPIAYLYTYAGNVMLTKLCNILFNVKLTDSYTCYKLIPLKIAKSLNLYSRGFEIEAEITGKLAKNRIPIIEVPISYKPRSYKEGKKIKAKDAIFGIKSYFKIRFS